MRIVFFFSTVLILYVNEVFFESLQPENRRDAPYRFGVPEKDVPSRIESIVKMLDDSLTRQIVEIDQDVAAKDEIEPPHFSHCHPVIQVQMLRLYKRGGSLTYCPFVATW